MFTMYYYLFSVYKRQFFEHIYTHTYTRAYTFPSTYIYLRSESSSVSLGLLGLNQFEKERAAKGSWTIDGTFYIEYSCTYRIWNEIDTTIEKGMIFCVNVDWQHRTINFPIFKIVEIDFFLETKTHVQKFYLAFFNVFFIERNFFLD